jgi:hypothetical protein
MKFLVVTIIVITVISSVVLAYLCWYSPWEENNQEEDNIEIVNNNYNIFGEDKFDTIVKGYLEMKEIERFDSVISTAYFIITEFNDDGLRKSIEEGIDQRNTVNIKEGDLYGLNLGCFRGGRIEGIEYEVDTAYIDDYTQEKIISSSLENQVSLILSFGYHLGRGCDCCNLAHSVRISD